MPSNERTYAHRSLVEKLGIKRDHRVCLRGIRDEGFVALITAHVEQPPARTARGTFDAIVYEVHAPRDLDAVESLATHLVPNGGLWILHPKGKGASPHDSEVRAAGIAAGLVDNKVCAYNDTHTATRFVIPLAKRR